MQLRFRSRLSLPLFTGGKVEGEQGAAIHVVLIDTSTGHVVTSGPESSVKLDVVVLEGDFNNEDDDDWTQEHFESNVVKEREGKRPLLTGELQVSLKEGVGSLGELTFTDNSSWIRSRKFRLGVKVASGSCEGIRVREAKTDAFTVKDHRGECRFLHTIIVLVMFSCTLNCQRFEFLDSGQYPILLSILALQIPAIVFCGYCVSAFSFNCHHLGQKF